MSDQPEELAQNTTEPAQPSAPQDTANTQTDGQQTFAQRIDAIEEAVNALAEDWVDQGNGLAVHVINIRSAVNGLRDAERAWAHLTQSPVSAGEARG